MSTKFEIGKQYNGWSSDYSRKAPPLVVVEISPDRSYLMGYNPDEDLHKLEKYQIKRSDWHEKVVIHPDKWAYFVWRSDKAVKDVDISNPDWVNAQTYRRKQGAAKANKTKSDKAMLRAFADHMTLEQFCKAFAILNKMQISKIPGYEDVYDQQTDWKKLMKYYQKQKDFKFGTGGPRLSWNFGRLNDYQEYRGKYCFEAYVSWFSPPSQFDKWGSHHSDTLYCFIDKVVVDNYYGPKELPDKDFKEIFGDIEVC